MLLQINGLEKYYGGVCALKNISLSVDAGSVVGLIGNNGAGKSTLVKCITGLEKPDKGEIHFNGQVLAKNNPYASRQAGIEMVYQNLNLCPQLNVASNIFLGQEMLKGKVWLDRKAMTEKARSIMESLNAEIDVQKQVSLLSGGQQQAVAIARALLSDPKLLIMDEPTAALGVRESANALALIKSLKAQGVALILISHKLSDILEVADRVVVMRLGEISENISIESVSMAELSQKMLI